MTSGCSFCHSVPSRHFIPLRTSALPSPLNHLSSLSFDAVVPSVLCAHPKSTTVRRLFYLLFSPAPPPSSSSSARLLLAKRVKHDLLGNHKGLVATDVA